MRSSAYCDSRTLCDNWDYIAYVNFANVETVDSIWAGTDAHAQDLLQPGTSAWHYLHTNWELHLKRAYFSILHVSNIYIHGNHIN